MVLKLSDYQEQVRHAIGGGEPSFGPAGTATTQIVNEAGRYLCAMHHWKFLERTPATLDFTASQAYIDMPADFKSIDTIEPDDAINATFTLTSPKEIARLRQFDIVLAAAYYGTIVSPKQPGATQIMPVQRLEVYPTPSATDNGALHIWYTRGWTELVNADDVPNIPLWAESLLVQLVRVFAKGREEEDIAGIDQRLASIAGGHIVTAVLSQDSQSQPHFSEVLGGWTRLEVAPLTWNPVSAP